MLAKGSRQFDESMYPPDQTYLLTTKLLPQYCAAKISINFSRIYWRLLQQLWINIRSNLALISQMPWIAKIPLKAT